jgi:hypothetical protein
MFKTDFLYCKYSSLRYSNGNTTYWLQSRLLLIASEQGARIIHLAIRLALVSSRSLTSTN